MKFIVRVAALFALFVAPPVFVERIASAQELYPDVSGNSKPLDTQINVALDKGRRGLLYHFNCIVGGNNSNPTNSCFPLGHYDATGKLLSLGSTASVTLTAAGSPCTLGSSPAPGACSYTILDAFGRGKTCTNPTPPHNNDYDCADTVEIFFNGNFSNGASITEQIQNATGNEAGSSVTQDACGTAQCTLTFTASDSSASNPISIELVFDISGSMACSATSTNCPAGVGEIQRMAALKSASSVFFSTLNSFAISGDKLGLSTFSTAAIPDPSSCSGTNLKAANNSGITQIQGQVSGLAPTNSTSIGAGLLSADTCGFAGDTGGNAKKEILLFSDGEQNDKNQVGFSSSNHIQVSDVTGASFSDYPASNTGSDIRICPVTAGRLTAVGYNLQSKIAKAACNGVNAHIRDTDTTFAAADLDTFFAQSLTISLPTDKLELVDDSAGTLPRGGTVVEKYLGNTDDVKTAIAISWIGAGREDVPVVTLTAPDGQTVDLTGKMTFRPGHIFIDLPFPTFRNSIPIMQKGLWQITLDGSRLISQQINYHVLVMSDNPTVSTDFQFAMQDIGTGDPIPIKVKLTDGGKPVLNAVVQAELIGPQNSLGNILSTTPATLGPNNGPDPASTKGQQKLDALLANPATANLFGDQTLPSLKLFDNGSSSNGDTTANDGIYSGLFTDTSKEGHYYFAIRVLATSAKAGDYQRAFRVTEFVRSIAADAQTTWQVVSSVPQSNGTRLVTISTTPHDKLGNYIGPGYEKDLQITSSLGTVQTPLADNLDGSYQITYDLPSLTSNPGIGVVVLGLPVKQGPLNSIPGGGSGSGGGTGFGAGKFAVSFHIGGTAAPNGSLSGASPSVSVGGDFEYRLPYGVSLETYLGYDRFTAAGTGFHFVNLSERFKYTYGTGRWRPFAFFGGGGYFATGGNNYGGINVGGGLQYWINHHFAAEGTYTFHNVFVSGNNAKYSTATVGVRYVF